MLQTFFQSTGPITQVLDINLRIVRLTQKDRKKISGPEKDRIFDIALVLAQRSRVMAHGDDSPTSKQRKRS